MYREAKILMVDLSTKSYRTDVIPKETMADYLGGRGLGARLLYTAIGPGVDPLSPDNPLIFTVGLAQGMDVPFSSKAVVTTKSPLTGLYLFSVSGGAIGHCICKAGFMAILIRGSSEQPIYLNISGGTVEFRDACHLWGMSVSDTQKALQQEAGNAGASAAVIGPGGEKRIRYASIMTEGEKFRAFGRGGAGCVMGSKKLKGILISGKEKLLPQDQEAMKELKKKVRKGIEENSVWAEGKRRYGTGEDMPFMNQLGMLPTNNWQTGILDEDKLKGIAPLLNNGRWPRKNISCGPYCPNPCSHNINIPQGPYAGAVGDGPEYETMYAFGSNCGIGKFDAIVKAAEICDESGIDTISAGVTIGFLIECFMKGLIDTSHTDGINLQFGDDGAVIECLKKIVSREGAGYDWGEGTRKLSVKIPGSSAFAMHCKGMELGGYECRGYYGTALQFALNPKGGDQHGYGLPARMEATDGTNRRVKGKGEALKKDALGKIIVDSLVLCTFPGKIMVPLFLELLYAVTGTAYSKADLDRIAMRILTQERLFNTREGLRREDDALPARLLQEPLPEGPNKGSTVPLEELKDEAYSALGWDLKTGIPQQQVVTDLGIV